MKMFFNQFKSTLYVQIWESRIKVSCIETKRVYDEQPLVAIESDKKGNQTIVAIGNNALAQDYKKTIEVINPFSHPRLLFSDFEVGEKLLQHIVRCLSKKRVFRSSPRLVIHPMEKTEGGLTSIEKRAFQELAYGAGARDVVIYQGKLLAINDFDFEVIKAGQSGI